MNLIANVDCSWGLGRDGQLLFHIPADLRFFRRMTLGGAVILGRKTLNTLPGGRPLAGRTNIVLSTTAEQIRDADVCSSIAAACRSASAFSDADVYVIGGASVYAQMLPLCDTAYITKVEADGGADCFLTNLDKTPGWSLDGIMEHGTDEQLAYTICRYIRSSPASASKEFA